MTPTINFEPDADAGYVTVGKPAAHATTITLEVGYHDEGMAAVFISPDDARRVALLLEKEADLREGAEG